MRVEGWPGKQAVAGSYCKCATLRPVCVRSSPWLAGTCRHIGQTPQRPLFSRTARPVNEAFLRRSAAVYKKRTSRVQLGVVHRALGPQRLSTFTLERPVNSSTTLMNADVPKKVHSMHVRRGRFGVADAALCRKGGAVRCRRDPNGTTSGPRTSSVGLQPCKRHDSLSFHYCLFFLQLILHSSLSILP